MKEETFTKILGEIDEKYVNEVPEETRPRRAVPLKKWAALAACFCIIAISATAVIAEVFDMKFLGNELSFHKNGKVSFGYIIESEEIFLPESIFGERFAEAEEGLAKSVDWTAGCGKCQKSAPVACEHHKKYGKWSKAFYEGPQEAIDIIGYEKIIYPELDYEHNTTYLYISGRKDPVFVESISVSSSYEKDNIWIRTNLEFLTENAYEKFQISHGREYWVPIQSEEKYVTIENGTKCLMVKTTAAEGAEGEDKYIINIDGKQKEFCISGYIFRDGIYYQIDVYGCSGDEEEAKKIFFEWANHY